MSENKKDFGMMIERNYDILNTFEKKMNNFFTEYNRLDQKIVEKETAFLKAKNAINEFFFDTKESLNEMLDIHRRRIVDVEKYLKHFTEELKIKSKENIKEDIEVLSILEKNRILKNIENVSKNFEELEINLKNTIKEVIKELPAELKKEKEFYIKKEMEEIKSTTNLFINALEELKAKMIEDIEKYNNSLEKQINKIELASAEIENNRKILNDGYKRLEEKLELLENRSNELSINLKKANQESLMKKITTLLFVIVFGMFITKVILKINIIIYDYILLFFLTVLFLIVSYNVFESLVFKGVSD